jgi:hypothetical protein
VAAALGGAGLATLVLDLLTPEEETAERTSGRFRFDVELLAERLLAAADWLAGEQHTAGLRAAYPAAELVLLGPGWHARFLVGRPGPVDRCLPVPPTPGIRDDRPPSPPPTLDRFFARMRAERFDLAVQLQGGGGHSNPFVSRLGARVTAGSRAPDAPPLDRTVPYTPHQHEIHRFLEVVGLVGAAPVTLEPRLAVTAADRAEAAAALAGPVGKVGTEHEVGFAELVVNATPQGLAGSGLDTLAVDPVHLGPGQLVVDLVPNPPVTPLMKAARLRGARAAGGLGMLVHQGALAFELWTGRPAPLDVMRTAAVDALR